MSDPTPTDAEMTTDIPALLAEVERLRAELAAAREALARVEADRDALVRLTQEAISVHRDLHKIYGSTATCGGGLGGQTITQHCGVTCAYDERHQADQDRWYAVESAYFRRWDGDPEWVAAIQPATDEKGN